MTAESSRSEQVINAYKKHKLAVSALHRVRRMLHGFEQERTADRRLALFGIALLILLMLAVAAWLFLGGGRVIIS